MEKLSMEHIASLHITYGYLLGVGAPPQVILPIEEIIMPKYAIHMMPQDGVSLEVTDGLR